MIFLIRWLAPSPKAAIDSCGAKGYAVSAVVVDRAGEVIVAMRSDGSSPHTMENAPQGLRGAQFPCGDFGTTQSATPTTIRLSANR
jgi:hypothetical protein